MERFLIQTVGFVGAVLLVLSYQFKGKRTLYKIQFASNCVYAVHFYLLGALPGCANLAVSALRNLLVSWGKETWLKYSVWMWILLAACIGVTAATWQNAYSLLPCVGMLAATVASFSHSGKTIRILNFCIGSPAWLLYDIYSGSISGVLCESSVMLSIMISLLRFWKQGRSEINE